MFPELLHSVEKWIVLAAFVGICVLVHWALLRLAQYLTAARQKAEAESRGHWQLMALRASEALSKCAADGVQQVEDTLRPKIVGASPDGTLSADQAKALALEARTLAWTQAKACFGAALAAVGEDLSSVAGPQALGPLVQAAAASLAKDSRANGNVPGSVAPVVPPSPAVAA